MFRILKLLALCIIFLSICQIAQSQVPNDSLRIKMSKSIVVGLDKNVHLSSKQFVDIVEITRKHFIIISCNSELAEDERKEINEGLYDKFFKDVKLQLNQGQYSGFELWKSKFEKD